MQPGETVEIPPWHAVERRHQHGLGAEQRPDGIGGTTQGGRLDRQDDDVLDADRFRIVGAWRIDDHIAVPGDEAQAVRAHRREVVAARDQAHRLAGGGKARAEQTAHRAGAKDADPQPGHRPELHRPN